MNLNTNVNCQTLNQGNYHYIFHNDIADIFEPELLSADYWQKKSLVTGTAQGRGTTYFVKAEQHNWVLRHYYRGGLIGKFLNDTYFYTGLNNTRAVKEFNLLLKLHQFALPAPKPIACKITRKGLGYNADILSERITNAKDLVGILATTKLSPAMWQKIGKCIKQFHQQGVFHHDLNCHNILIDENEKVWLIDFDQGELRTPDKSWQQANIERLKRSFMKEKGRIDNFCWQEEEFDHLLAGYNQ